MMDNTTLTDDLIAEIELQGKGKTIHNEGHMYYPPEMVHSLMARMRSLRADAERYRGMRAIVMKSTGMAEDEYNSRADDVIALDAARQAHK